MLNKVENIVAKGWIAHHEQFHLWPQCFQMSSAAIASKCVCRSERFIFRMIFGLFQSNPDDKLGDNIVTVDGLGLLFIIFYVVILFIQFFGMLMHRWGTFLHLVAVTELKNPFQKVYTRSILLFQFFSSPMREMSFLIC